jgi:hypothetical protein
MTEQALSELDLEQYKITCREGVNRKAAALEQHWLTANLPFCWIEHQPNFMIAQHFWDMALPRIIKPTRRILRFALPGGGQIRVSEKHVRFQFRLVDYEDIVMDGDPQLMITPHHHDQVLRIRGSLQITRYHEMDRSAVVLQCGSPPGLAERVAATLRVIEFPDDIFALLDGTHGCAICGRTLRDEVSKLLYIGPECARKLGRPHNLLAASAIVARRQVLLQRAAQF